MKLIQNINDAIPCFILSISRGDVLAVDKLLRIYPKLVYIRDKDGRNPLIMAAYFNSESFTYLFNHCVIINPIYDLNYVDNSNFNAYDWAVLGNNKSARMTLEQLLSSAEDSDEEDLD